MGNLTGIIIAVVAIIALAIGWVAYNRSGEDLENQALDEANEVSQEVEQESEEVASEAELAAARAQARSRILALEAQVRAEEGLETAEAELADIRADLRATYERASINARQEYEDIAEEFDGVEAALRAGSANVLELFAGLTAMLAGDVRVDEDEMNAGATTSAGVE